MWPAVLAAAAVVWIGVAGVGMGYLVEPELHPHVERALRALRRSDGLQHVEPAPSETLMWTRRWSRVVGFLALFAGAVVISLLPVEDEVRRIMLGAYAVVIPLLGYGRRMRSGSKRGPAGGAA